ncbi:MAG: TRAP transporter substrate-binding protein DctP [Thermodesulfobacteriota bacterium]|nr:TRAP transporter substrate-binding protein DctP [Thermodesulfobacteriota bacterium]
MPPNKALKIKKKGKEINSKRIFNLTLLLFGFLLITSDISYGSEEKPKVIWKIATHAPESIGYAVRIKRDLNPAIIEATNGNVTLDWYWGGIMGDREDWISKIQINQLQGGAFDGQAIVMVCPQIVLLELPFLFSCVDEAMYVRKIFNMVWRNGTWNPKGHRGKSNPCECTRDSHNCEIRGL